MTNYNERLDEVLDTLNQFAPDQLVQEMRAQAKQAITSLIKELVAEAKPKKHNIDVGDWYQCTFCEEYNKGIDQFEQNLLKALEEV